MNFTDLSDDFITGRLTAIVTDERRSLVEFLGYLGGCRKAAGFRARWPPGDRFRRGDGVRLVAGRPVVIYAHEVASMNLFQFSSIVGALGGAIALGHALADHGMLLTGAGVLAGLGAGWFLGPMLVFACFVAGIVFQQGPRAAWRFLSRRDKASGE